MLISCLIVQQKYQQKKEGKWHGTYYIILLSLIVTNIVDRNYFISK